MVEDVYILLRSCYHGLHEILIVDLIIPEEHHETNCSRYTDL